MQREATPASIADVYRVHDYNYLMKVLQLTNKLSLTENKIISRFDRDSALSEKTWECSLLACGAMIEAVDRIMRGETTNAFCAVRPPGHHAGVFGRTK